MNAIDVESPQGAQQTVCAPPAQTRPVNADGAVRNSGSSPTVSSDEQPAAPPQDMRVAIPLEPEFLKVQPTVVGRDPVSQSQPPVEDSEHHPCDQPDHQADLPDGYYPDSSRASEDIDDPAAEPQPVTATRNTLTVVDRHRLAQLEGIIAEKLESVMDVARALKEIKDSRLYLDQYATWEDYCQRRWGFTGRRARQLISAERQTHCADQKNNGNHGSAKLPNLPVRNERQARELARAPDEQRAVIWQKAVDRTGGRPTAAVLKEIIDETLGTAKGGADGATTAASHSNPDNDAGIEKPGEPGIAAVDVQSPPAPEPDQDQVDRRTPAEIEARLAELQRERVKNTKEIFALLRRLLSVLLKDVEETSWTRRDRKEMWRLASQLAAVAFDIECALA